MENFDSRVNDWFEWQVATWGAGGSVILSHDRSLHGRYSAKGVCGTSNSQCFELGRDLPFPQTGKLGAAITFFPDANLHDVEILAFIKNGVTYFEAGLKVQADQEKLFYADSAGVYQEVADGKLYGFEANCWHSVKLVFDLNADAYVRAMVNQTLVDLSAYALRSSASVSNPEFGIVFRFTDGDGSASVVYVDNIIITQNDI